MPGNEKMMNWIKKGKEIINIYLAPISMGLVGGLFIFFILGSTLFIILLSMIPYLQIITIYFSFIIGTYNVIFNSFVIFFFYSLLVFYSFATMQYSYYDSDLNEINPYKLNQSLYEIDKSPHYTKVCYFVYTLNEKRFKLGKKSKYFYSTVFFLLIHHLIFGIVILISIELYGVQNFLAKIMWQTLKHYNF